MPTTKTGTPSTGRDRTRRVFTLIPLIALLALAVARGADAAAQDAATPVATPVPADTCELVAPGVGAESWVRTELYFGTTRPDGTDVTPGEWQEFLDEEITPRFPAGLTILEGYGQFLNEEGVIAAEESVVLIVFYPAAEVESASASFEEIRDAYEEQFDQESVLRVDSEPVCVSF
ncbi:MAG TPA: DUF3574 domain-containing protein [Thermomicrobiales bacterium]|nr:DUF3574 domain-containing protein [Thermomicrobiales bacterium]